MTETTTTQSPDTTTTGTASTSSEPAGGGAAAGGAPWFESFKNEAIRTSPAVQRYDSPEAMAEGFIALEKRFGIDPNRRLDLPADPADTEGWRAVWTRLGLPEKPEGYDMKLEDNATDADRALLTAFSSRAHELGLPKDMARGVMGFWMEQVAAAQEAAARDFEARAAAGTAALKKEWGQAYDQRAAEVGRALANYGDPELAAELDGKLGNYPNLSLMIGRMLDRMAEPDTAGGRGGEGDPGQRALSPSQAVAAAKAIEAKPGFRDASHPEHKALVAERNRLLQMAESAA